MTLRPIWADWIQEAVSCSSGYEHVWTACDHGRHVGISHVTKECVVLYLGLPIISRSMEVTLLIYYLLKCSDRHFNGSVRS